MEKPVASASVALGLSLALLLGGCAAASDRAAPATSPADPAAASSPSSSQASSPSTSAATAADATADAATDPETAARWPLLAAEGVRADGVYGAGYEVTGQPAPRVEERLVVGQAPGLIWLATESSEGHGVVVSRDGLVLTAAHVVEGEGPLRAAVAVGNRLEEREVEVLGGDRVADVALLRVSGGAPVAVPRLDPSLHQGRDELAAVGWFLEDDLPSAVRGTVAGLHAEVTVHDDPSLDGEGVEMEGLTAVRGEAPKGFSGGPAVGEDGAVRGLSVAATDGHTLVRPLHDALDVAEQVLSGEPTDTVTLGAP